MSAETRIMAADELWRMPPDDLRRELVNGELKTMAPAGFDHGLIGSELHTLLGVFVKANKLGRVLSVETGFLLRRNPDTVRAPDVAFLKAARIQDGRRTVKYFDGAPDLAIEVVSPSDTVEELDEKIADYLSAGCNLVWVVHPKTKSITVHRPGAQPMVLREADKLDGQDVVPGFSCSVAEIFA